MASPSRIQSRHCHRHSHWAAAVTATVNGSALRSGGGTGGNDPVAVRLAVAGPGVPAEGRVPRPDATPHLYRTTTFCPGRMIVLRPMWFSRWISFTVVP